MAAFLSPLALLFKHGSGDPSSFTSANDGKAPAPGQLAPESILPSQDSLTQYMRSMTNYMGQKGQDTFNAGEGTFKTGQDTFGKGTGTMNAGLEKTQPSFDILSKLLSGNRGAVAEAMQPQVDPITAQFGQIRQMFSQTGARGGGTTSTLAQSPFNLSRNIADETAQQRHAAINEAASLGMGEAGLGTQEQQIGTGQSQLGLAQSGLGEQMLGQTLQGLLGRRGQNFQVDMNNINNLTKGLESVLSGPLSELAGYGMGSMVGMNPDQIAKMFTGAN